MLDLDKLLDAADERVAEKRVTELGEIHLAGELLTLKFTELAGDEWATFTMAHTPRKSVPLDHAFGYNVSAATKDALAASAVLVDGDSEQKLSDEQWARLYRGTDPQGRQVITSGIFAVNEAAELARIDAARKASEAVSKRKRRSPAN